METDAPKACCGPSRMQPSTPPRPQKSLDGQKLARAAFDIPGGQALIGTNAPLFAVDGETPLRRKRIKPFKMDATAVSNMRFEAFVNATGYETDAERIGDSFVFQHFLPKDAPPSQAVAEAPWWRVIPGANWRAIYGPGSEGQADPNHPVVHVTWNDATAFAKWAGGRLPTEAEWEHAARGGLGDVRYPWGDQDPNDLDFFPCNIWQGVFPHSNSGADRYPGTAPVDAFAPNGFGLYNMVGNVWEWTSEPFKVRSLRKDITAANAAKRGFKLNKGGSFLCHASYCHRYRIAARSGSTPDSSTSHQGFRLVYDA